MKKLGMYGGTFDPIHTGHLALCETMRIKLGLDEVMIVPTGTPPHKEAKGTSGEDRMEMCRIAIKDSGIKARVSDIEVRREGKSYSLLTVKELLEEDPEREIYLIMGADMFMSLETWYHFDELAQLATFCAVCRGETSDEELEEYAGKLRAMGCRCILEKMNPIDISSTEIREKVARSEKIEGLTSPGVEEYIKKKGLYKKKKHEMDAKKREEYKRVLRDRLSGKRYKHCLNVAKEAVRLAKKYGEDEALAEEAGLLHDVTKEAQEDEHKKLIAKRETMTELEDMTSKLWHAMSGAAYAQFKLGVENEDVLNAIRYHTTGRRGMSKLEKIIFIADFTSADRDYKDVDVMRKKADESLEAALCYSLDYTIHDLLKKGRTVHPDTLDAYDEYKG